MHFVWLVLLATGLVNQPLSPWKITATWQQSDSPNIVYNTAYCGKKSGGPYTFKRRFPKRTEIEYAGAPGGIMYCAVTATNAAGDESSYSNEVQAIIP
jgi:hypothetical protein